MKRLTVVIILASLSVAMSPAANAFLIQYFIYKTVVEDAKIKVGAIVRTATVINPLRYAIDVARGKSTDQVYKERLDQLKEDLLTLVPTGDVPAKAYLLRARIDVAHEILGNDAANIFALTQAPLMLTDGLRQLPRASTEYLISVFEDLDNAKNFPGILLSMDLFASIDHFKDQAKPIPQPIRGYLACHFSHQTLDRARYVVNDDPTTVNGTINWIQMVAGDSTVDNHAVVSGNIIVFARTPKTDDKNFKFWAHEVAHTEQYERWGIAGFSKQYMFDHGKVEGAADNEAEIAYKKFIQAGKKAC